MAAVTKFINGINDAVNDSFVGRFFDMKEKKTTLTKEFKGAATTFLAMAYILAVNPRIMADSGGPCVPSSEEEGGIFSAEYEACLETVRRQYVTATAVASMFGCFAMGLMANLPIALSAGMGMNAYFTYGVVGWRGTGTVSYNAAVTAVLIEGFIFMILALTGVRYFIIKFVPEPVRIATPAGIGAFLAHLGLQTAEGLGVVVGDIATAVTLGGCAPEDRTPLVAYDEACRTQGICVISDNYTCDPNKPMRSATTWLGIVGLFITAVMLCYRRKGAFLLGIAFVTVVSWFRNTAVTYFPDTEDGNARFDYFSQVVSIEPVNLIFAKYSGDLGAVAVALITFLYVDFLDTSGTLFALASSLGYINEEGDFPKSRWAFTADALSTSFGSLFGLSPVTSFVESAAGVEAGARTGLAACFCGFFFFLSIFFAPIIASIPPWATGGCLVIVGSLMCRSLGDVRWDDPAHALTAFVTVILMPLTYSIAYGLLGGLFSWFGLQIVFRLLKLAGIHRPKPTAAQAMMEGHELKGIVKPEDEITEYVKPETVHQEEDESAPHEQPQMKDIETPPVGDDEDDDVDANKM